MNADALVEVILALIVFGIPAGALAARFVLRPMLREIAEAIRTIREPGSPALERRLTELEEGQLLINKQLRQLVEAERFHRELGSGKRTDRQGEPNS
jgi:hypothetical protein